MEIQKTSAVQSVSSDPKNQQSNLSRLQQGATVNAVVLDLVADNTYILKLSDGQQVRAQTANALEPGQVLKLEVIKTGLVPELKIVMPQLAVPQGQTVVLEALKQYMPKQVSLAEFTASLPQATVVAEVKPGSLSAAVNEVLGALLSKDELMSADGLKQGINNSGVFLEAKLANLLSPQGDLKAHLLTLADALQKVPSRQNGLSGNESMHKTIDDADKALLSFIAKSGETDNAILNKTEGAIARIVLDQLASLPKNDDQQNFWQIEIPFKDGNHSDSVKLKINRDENSGKDSHQANWSVVLELSPPGMGTLRSKISLIDDKVHTYFWSDQKNTSLMVQEQIDLLASRYAEAGLAVGNLGVLEGSGMNINSAEPEIIPKLLDEYI
jgi:Flagellar hook-length control protein FliK